MFDDCAMLVSYWMKQTSTQLHSHTRPDTIVPLNLDLLQNFVTTNLPVHNIWNILSFVAFLKMDDLISMKLLETINVSNVDDSALNAKFNATQRIKCIHV